MVAHRRRRAKFEQASNVSSRRARMPLPLSWWRGCLRLRQNGFVNRIYIIARLSVQQRLPLAVVILGFAPASSRSLNRALSICLTDTTSSSFASSSVWLSCTANVLMQKPCHITVAYYEKRHGERKGSYRSDPSFHAARREMTAAVNMPASACLKCAFDNMAFAILVFFGDAARASTAVTAP